jgi:hypothetical protein
VTSSPAIFSQWTLTISSFGDFTLSTLKSPSLPPERIVVALPPLPRATGGSNPI